MRDQCSFVIGNHPPSLRFHRDKPREVAEEAGEAGGGHPGVRHAGH